MCGRWTTLLQMLGVNLLALLYDLRDLLGCLGALNVL